MTQHLSLRDPAGQVIFHENRVFRFVYDPKVASILESETVLQLVDAGHLPRTIKLDTQRAEVVELQRDLIRRDQSIAQVLEHERIPFISYPAEWPPEMLCAAGRLTIDIAQKLSSEGLGLKDATPFNIIFRGAQPVLVDLLSIERRDPHSPLWLPYAQFVRTFLLPLAAARHFDMKIQDIFLSRREGLEPSAVYRLCSPLRALMSPFLFLATIPALLERPANAAGKALYSPRPRISQEQAGYTLSATLKRARKAIDKLEPHVSQSAWSAYETANSYNDNELACKEEIVRSVCRLGHTRRVLDLGCNAGRFSRAAAESGSSVVAVDRDPAVVGMLWRLANRDKLAILPLVVDICRPTPPTGWNNQENFSFLERATGHFDLILALALMHHIIAGEGIPLEEFIGFLARLRSQYVLLEFVPPDDPLFQYVARGRDELHRSLTIESFEAACAKYFTIKRRYPITDAGRTIYLLRLLP